MERLDARPAPTPRSRLAEVDRWFSSLGLSLERPWLNRSSADLYELPG